MGYTSDYSTWEKYQKRYEDEWREKFKNTYERMKKNTSELLSSDTLSEYKTIRDKLLAHNELRLIDGKYDTENTENRDTSHISFTFYKGNEKRKWGRF